MEKSIKRIFVLVLLGLFIVPGISASAANTDATETKSSVLAQGNISFSRIGLTEVPQAVKSAVAVKYAAYRIGESYIGSDNTYKLIIENGKTKLTVIYQKNGECIKSDTNSVWKQIVLG